MTEDPTLSGPIESLQLMLRTLSMLDEELPTLVPDGIYGSATANAVSAFQKKHQSPGSQTVTRIRPSWMPTIVPCRIFPLQKDRWCCFRRSW